MKKNYFQCGITQKNIIISYIIALLPLLIYGLYKNSIIVYNRGLINFSQVIIQMVMIIITYMITLLSDVIYCKLRKKRIKEYIPKSFSIIFATILFLSLPPIYNKTIYIVALLSLVTLIKIIPYDKLSINIIALIKISLISIAFVNNSIEYANIYEQSKNISYNLYNSFFGKTIGGIGTTNIFLICLSYIYLSTKIHYKKEIPIYSLLSFVITGLIYLIITHQNPTNIINALLTTNIIFVLVFLSTIPQYSTSTKEGMFVYGIITGILSYIFMYTININEGAYIAIIVTSSLSKIIDYIILKIKNRQNVIK